MTKDLLENVKKFCTKEANYLGYLKARYNKEKEYEDFSEYKKAIIERAKKYNVTPTKITKKIEIFFKQEDGSDLVIKATTRTVELYTLRAKSKKVA